MPPASAVSDLTVVGAGVGGLVLARALAAKGVGCSVLEAADGPAPLGGGLQLAPNATRLLLRLGLGPALDDVASRPTARYLLRGDDDRVLAVTPLVAAGLAGATAPYLTLRRTDLRAALLGGTNVHWGHRVTAVHEAEDLVELVLADGRRRTSMALVGADGVGSVIRTAVGPHRQDVGVEPPRALVHRGVVARDDLPPALRSPAVRVWVGRGQHCVAYPVGRGGETSIAAVVPVGTDASPARGDVLAAYRGWSPALRHVLARTRFLGCWPLRDSPPLARWSTRRLTLVGDAAHPMLPFLAQGANQAVEDAVTLAVFLAAPGAEDVAAALQRYERQRRPRTTAVQAASRTGARSGGAWLHDHDPELVADATVGLDRARVRPVGSAT